MNCTFSEIRFFTWKTISTIKLFKKWNTELYHQKASMKTECTFVMVNGEIRPQSDQLFSRWLVNLSNWKADDFPKFWDCWRGQLMAYGDKLPRGLGGEGRKGIYLIVNSYWRTSVVMFLFPLGILTKKRKLVLWQ